MHTSLSVRLACAREAVPWQSWAPTRRLGLMRVLQAALAKTAMAWHPSRRPPASALPSGLHFPSPSGCLAGTTLGAEHLQERGGCLVAPCCDMALVCMQAGMSAQKRADLQVGLCICHGSERAPGRQGCGRGCKLRQAEELGPGRCAHAEGRLQLWRWEALQNSATRLRA